ncbi:hypothetical protein U9M48_029193 [Paspalum notatum var. saurae]|uniref:Uncharacterized protein n=1 Tax=Paspalum notatum var. saurae TaxID=547442 RepID=A0AAQ3U0Z8_PASNO
MAVPTNPQILGDPHRVAGPRVQEPKGDGQLLTVVQQWRLLVLLCNVMQHVPRVGHVALFPDPPHHVPGHGVHLLHLGLGAAQDTALELVDLAVDLNRGPPGFLAHVPLVHQPPDLGHILPPSGSGEEVRQQNVAPAVLRIQLDDAPPDRLAHIDIAVDPACAQECAEHADVRFHGHVVDQLLGFVQLPCSSIQVDHAAVVLHLGLHAVSPDNWRPWLTMPACAQAVSTFTSVTSSGATPSLSIRANSSTAFSPRPCTANPPIMQFHDESPLAGRGRASNTRHASSTHPHLQYMSTTAAASFSSTSIPSRSTHRCTSLPRASAPAPVHATTAVAATKPLPSTPRARISSNTSSASRNLPAFTYPDIMAFHDTRFRSGIASNSSRASSTSPSLQSPPTIVVHDTTSRAAAPPRKMRAARPGLPLAR